MAVSSDINVRLKTCITERLAKEARPKWEDLEKQFPEVSPRTFSRRVAECRAELSAAAKIEAAAATPSDAEADALSRPDESEGNLDDIIELLVAGLFGTDFRGLDITGRCEQNVRDAERLKACALGPDGEIRNPRLFAQAVALSQKAVETAGKIGTTVWAAEQRAEFVSITLGHIYRHAPDILTKFLTLYNPRTVSEAQFYDFNMHRHFGIMLIKRQVEERNLSDKVLQTSLSRWNKQCDRTIKQLEERIKAAIAHGHSTIVPLFRDEEAT